PHVGRRHRVGADQFQARVVDLVFAVAHLDLVDAGRLEQPAGVLGQAKIGWPARRGVHALALEHRRAVVQCVRADMDVGIGPRLDPAVVPDEGRTHAVAPRALVLRGVGDAVAGVTGACRSMRLTMASAACAVASTMSVLTPSPFQSRPAWRATSRAWPWASPPSLTARTWKSVSR